MGYISFPLWILDTWPTRDFDRMIYNYLRHKNLLVTVISHKFDYKREKQSEDVTFGPGVMTLSPDLPQVTKYKQHKEYNPVWELGIMSVTDDDMVLDDERSHCPRQPISNQ